MSKICYENASNAKHAFRALEEFNPQGLVEFLHERINTEFSKCLSGDLTHLRKAIGMSPDYSDEVRGRIWGVSWYILLYVELKLILLTFRSGSGIFANVLSRNDMLSDCEQCGCHRECFNPDPKNNKR